MFRKSIVSAMLGGSLLLAGCATTLTPEQEAQLRRAQEEYARRMQQLVEQRMAQQRAQQNHISTHQQGEHAGSTQIVRNASEVAAVPVQPTEQELARRIDEARNTGQEYHHQIQRVRDGLEIDGKVYVDPEGELVAAGFDMVSGDVTYVVRDEASDERFAVNYMHVSTQEPIRIGTIRRRGSGFAFESVTGKRLSGDEIIPASRGIVMIRGVNVFLYQPGEKLLRVRVPEGYHVARLQRGDVASTHRILIEKDAPKENSGAELISILGALGNTLGMNRADHYALLDIDTGKAKFFDIHIQGKKVSTGTGCVQRSYLVRECSGSVSYESLYEPTGMRNSGHYYWRLSWFRTPEGVFAIVQEAGTKDINMYNLDTDEMANLFHRGLGIAWFDVLRDRNGMISVSAQMGFKKQRIDDAIAYFEQHKTIQTASKDTGKEKSGN